MASEITQLIAAYNGGDQAAFGRLADLIYAELKGIAQQWARRGSPMGATTLVNETFMKLLLSSQLTSTDKNEFLALSATIMRRVIIDEVRYVSARKRERVQVTWTDNIHSEGSGAQAEFLLAVDEALNALAQHDSRLLKVFECRYFAGYSTAETAAVLSASERSVERWWQDARNFLAQALAD